MATNWTVPLITDLDSVLTSVVTNPADETLTVGTRKSATLALIVANIRGTIGAAGRVPLSLTASSVPPEAAQHALILTVQMLVGAKPNLIQAVVGPNGSIYIPFNDLVKKANDWLKGIKDGDTCTVPTDPDTDFVGGIMWGDAYGADTDYEAGTVTVNQMKIGSDYPSTYP